MKALAMIDCQKDFIDGSLGVGLEKWEPAKANIIDMYKNNNYELLVYTKDWHPTNHCSFKEFNGIWPSHCVQDTLGSEIDEDLMKFNRSMTIEHKGKDSNKEEYGIDVLRSINLDETRVEEIDIVGLCTDYCVCESSIMTKESHPEVDVRVVLNACCSIAEDTKAKAIERMKSAGVKVIE